MEISKIDFNSPAYEAIVDCRKRNYEDEGKLRPEDPAYFASDKDGVLYAITSSDWSVVGTFTLHHLPYISYYYGTTLPFRGYCECSKLAIDKKYRSMRLLREVFDVIWGWAEENKCQHMVICVDRHKIKLYSRLLGFKVLPNSRFTHPVYKKRHCVMYLENKKGA